MSTNGYTPGPWRGGKARLHFEGGREVWAIFSGGQAPIATFPYASEAEANARRIVACVNACEGIMTDDVEALAALKCAIPGVAGVAQMSINSSALEEERDLLRERERELVETLGKLLDVTKRANIEVPMSDAPVFFAARELLSKHGR